MGDGGGTVRCTHLKIAGWKLIFCSRWVCLLKKYIYSILTIYLSLNLFNYVETSHIDLQYFAFEQELSHSTQTSWKWTHGRWVADHLNTQVDQQFAASKKSTHHKFDYSSPPFSGLVLPPSLFVSLFSLFLSFFLSFFCFFVCLVDWSIYLFIVWFVLFYCHWNVLLASLIDIFLTRCCNMKTLEKTWNSNDIYIYIST